MKRSNDRQPKPARRPVLVGAPPPALPPQLLQRLRHFGREQHELDSRIERLGNDLLTRGEAERRELFSRELESWQNDGLALAAWLLDRIDTRPLPERLSLAQLAGWISAESEVSPENPLAAARRGENLARARLAEVRALRRIGRLDEAREVFLEIDRGFSEDDAQMLFWLTLAADRDLTAALLLRDAGRLAEARDMLVNVAELFAVAGSETEDAALLFAQVRTELAAGNPALAVERAARAQGFDDPAHRLEGAFLAAHAALLTRTPLLARRAALGLVKLVGSGDRAALDAYAVIEAAVRLAEGRPVSAPHALEGPAERLRRSGSLLGSLRAALVACRAELAHQRLPQARTALRAGILERFDDLPATPAVHAALARLAEEARSSSPRPEFLMSFERWLALVEDSPGLALDGEK